MKYIKIVNYGNFSLIIPFKVHIKESNTTVPSEECANAMIMTNFTLIEQLM
jgi:hypothetical protein